MKRSSNHPSYATRMIDAMVNDDWSNDEDFLDKVIRQDWGFETEKKEKEMTYKEDKRMGSVMGRQSIILEKLEAIESLIDTEKDGGLVKLQDTLEQILATQKKPRPGGVLHGRTYEIKGNVESLYRTIRKDRGIEEPEENPVALSVSFDNNGKMTGYALNRDDLSEEVERLIFNLIEAYTK